LISDGVHLCKSIAKRYVHQGLDLADLVGECQLALVRAANDYDASLGVPWLAFARWRLRSSCQAAVIRSPLVRPIMRTHKQRPRCQAALEALQAEGIARPTTGEIAERAGLSPDIVQACLGCESLPIPIDAFGEYDPELVEAMA
jgi:DNA-directed RNA polymerase sigma subunit (sigma70/sigma32)